MARDRASRPDAKPLRLFVAIEVPLEVRGLVESAIAPWRETHPRARWVPQQNQHVTMKFLGATRPRLVAWAKEAVGEVAGHAKPFDSRIDGIGAFPSAHRARVLWAGLEDPDGRFAALAGLLDEALAKEFEREERAFTAHLTLARFEPQVELEGLERSSLVSESFQVSRLVLFRSHLQRPAPVYEPLGDYALGG
jgi:2'-5' RNA ligase